MDDVIIGSRKVGKDYPPLVIAEIGINHEGDFDKAKKMVKDAAEAGAECVKFQMHVIEDEMVPKAKETIPGNSNESIWDIMVRCRLKKEEHYELKKYCESLGIIYLCTPFSRAAADIIEEMGIQAYKIGSGECNNYPLIEHIASFGKPMIISTGMNNIKSIEKIVEIVKSKGVPLILLHCTSMYPTPYNKVRLGSLKEMEDKFEVNIGLSDHSLGIYTCLGAVSLGATVLEKHFTSDKSWSGPDVPISIDPKELREMVKGSLAIHQSLGGKKEILSEEQATIDFAYSSVVTIKDIKRGEVFSESNIWVKRPGDGIPAEEFNNIKGKKAARNIPKDEQLKREDIT